VKTSIINNKSVNIQMSASGVGIKEDLQLIASRRAVSVSKIVAQIYEYAVNNTNAFPTEILSPRPKMGKNISTKVSVDVVNKLTEWAKELGRSRANHCCFLLEVVLADGEIRSAIFR
jgi:predicted DNA-binding ribbon-helix-helix protein